MSSSNFSLFPEPPSFRELLAPRLRALAGEGVYVGTSSWKYEGWLGQIYAPERYATRGRFSRKRFEAECLGEYAETFPAVCGDFSFYQFPSMDYWARLFATAGGRLQFAFKVPEEITVREWPTHLRYGARAGRPNESFLNADLLAGAFLRPLEAYRAQVATLIFEFGTFPKRHYESVEPFAAQLGEFLGQLPAGWRYAVEIRNPDFLAPGYFETLRRRGAAHVFNAWSRMPELGAQTAREEAYTAEFTVTRALLRQGRSYEQAVAAFQPYSEIQDPNPATREALRRLIERSKQMKQNAFIFVNNRLEGNAPGTIAAVTGE